MEYFEYLQLEREPFSNSPDPDLFFCSDRQKHCLQQLEIAVRLRRGVSVVLGEVGTGKTTLFRRLLQNLSDLECRPFLDPDTGSIKEFLSLVLFTLTGVEPASDLEPWEYKEKIKETLLIKNLVENKTVVLLIDEGQKLSRQGIEILRELLNFETNTSKLLQLVIFAQPELKRHLDAMYNFTDRINFLYELKRFNLEECKTMITNRIALCSADKKAKKLFTIEAIKKIHVASKGRPRQIITLCHKLLLQLIVEKRKKVTGEMVDRYTGRKSNIFNYVKPVFIIFLLAVFTFWTTHQLTNNKKQLPNIVEKKQAAEPRWQINRDSVIKLY